MAKYSLNEEAEEIAQEIIPESHGEIEEARIRYLFVDKTSKTKGKVVQAHTRKADDLMDFLSGGVDFVITFSQEVWERLSDDQKRALVDHELCHCTVKTDKQGNEGFTTKGHDVEEFSEILERHGLWMEDLVDFMTVGGKQLKLGMPVGTTKRRPRNGHDQRPDA